MDIGERIEEVLNQKGMSKRRFAKLLKPSGARGISYPAIFRYLPSEDAKRRKGKRTPPPAEFVVAAAKVLGVMPGWLLTGEGPRTPEDVEAQRRALEHLMDPDRDGQEYVKGLDLGTGQAAEVRRDALLRFIRKLDAKSRYTPEFFEAGERAALVQAAATFMIGVDGAFQASTRTKLPNVRSGDPRPLVSGGILLGQSSAGGWLVYWCDAILDLFARRVIGLGERGAADPHAPAAGRGHRSLRI